MTELFEDNQRDLERAVENLGYSLEQPIESNAVIPKLRQDITNLAAYVQKRHDILLDDTLNGYLEVSRTSRPSRSPVLMPAGPLGVFCRCMIGESFVVYVIQHIYAIGPSMTMILDGYCHLAG